MKTVTELRTVVLYKKDFANLEIWNALTNDNNEIEEVTVKVTDEA